MNLLKKETEVEYEVGDLSLDGFVALRERSAIECVATVSCYSCPSRLEVGSQVNSVFKQLWHYGEFTLCYFHVR